MKLCLFNVENLFLFESPENVCHLKPVEKIEWIAKTILDIDADITMLCEVGGLLSFDHFNTLYLNSKYKTFMLKGNSDRGIEMGYLVKKNFPYLLDHFNHADHPINFNYSFEILENKKHPDLPPYPPHKFTRDVSELQIKQNNQVVLIILLVHLKSKWDKEGIDFLGKEKRKAEAIALIKIYQQRQKEFNHAVPIIIAGDMNGNVQQGLHDSEFDDLYQLTDLLDILEIIKTPYEERSSFFYFEKDKPKTGQQLDYIFIPKMIQPLVKKENSGIYLFCDQYQRPIPYPQDLYQRYALPSDHYPLVANFNFL